MTKRMTAEEVVAQFESYGAIARGSWNHAAQIVCDNLVPQWQDEPDGDGWYVVPAFVFEQNYEVVT